MKIHHCLMDGQSGIGLTEVLMDLHPEPESEVSPSQDMQEMPPRSPPVWEVARRAIENGIRRQSRFAMHAGRAARDYLQNFGETSHPSTSSEIPRVSFNRRLSRDRAFAFTTLPLGPLRDVKKHFDVTMNDILLEIVSSSMRRGLRRLGELPTASLVALCPISLRKPGDQSFGNQVASMPVTMATNLADPCDRLAVIHASAEHAKQRARDGAFEYITALAESLVPAALRLVIQAAHRVSEYAPIPANLVFSNIRGLPVSTYMAGARVEELYPMSMLQVANGMNVTAVTHDDQIDFGFLVDPKLIPDPWIFADGVRGALEELEVATREVASGQIAAEVQMPPPPPPAKLEIETGARPSQVLCEPESESDPLDLSLIMASLDSRRSARFEVD
jgi:WS/DGAT/MGAT family acyltransferase